MLSELEVRQSGVLGLVDNDAVARLVYIVVQPKIGCNPKKREMVNHIFQIFNPVIVFPAAPVHKHPVVGGHVRELVVCLLCILHLINQI